MSKSFSFYQHSVKQRWALFLGITLLLAGGLAVFVNAIAAAALSPVFVCISAAIAFRRVDVLVHQKFVSWKYRPFPHHRMKKLRYDQIVEWVYGPVPTSSNSRGGSTFAVAALRANRKLDTVTTVKTSEQAHAIALQLSAASGLPERAVPLMGSPKN